MKKCNAKIGDIVLVKGTDKDYYGYIYEFIKYSNNNHGYWCFRFFSPPEDNKNKAVRYLLPNDWGTFWHLVT
jgi:hypothetical protein